MKMPFRQVFASKIACFQTLHLVFVLPSVVFSLQGSVREGSLFRLRFEHALGSDGHPVSRRPYLGFGVQARMALHDQ